MYLRFSSHRWRHHVWGQSCRWVLASLLLLDQPHGQCELLRVQLSLLINVAKIPENVQVIVSILAVKFVLFSSCMPQKRAQLEDIGRRYGLREIWMHEGGHVGSGVFGSVCQSAQHYFIPHHNKLNGQPLSLLRRLTG